MKMFASERQDRIVELLKEQRRITIKELAEEMNVSEATLRTDLNKMEKQDLLIRTHGGAVLNYEEENETSFMVRSNKNTKEKIQIAEKAFELIKEKQSILLDASSTVLELARYIKSQPIRITVVTTGIHTALELNQNPDITVILLGGVATKGSSSIEGILGLDILNHINIDMMFTSANGFSSENGLTDFNIYEVQLKKEIVSRADKVIALIDSSKIEKKSSAVFAPIEEINTLITDEPFSFELKQKMKSQNIDLLISN